MNNRVAVLGSGTVGKVLAEGFTKHGYDVKQASRAQFAEAARWAEIVVVAVKGTAAEGVVKELAGALAGKPVIDTCNPIGDAPPQNGVIQYFTQRNDSLMQRLQKHAPQAKFVKAFNSVGNALMVNPKLPKKPTMFICGNDAGAKTTVTEILGQFGWDALDLGGVEAAGAIEELCVLWCIPGFLRNDWMHVIDYVKA